KNNHFGAEIENTSSKIYSVAVQGPAALKTLQKLTGYDLSSLPPFHFTTTQVADAKDVIVSTTGYTGSGGFELYFYNSDAENLWESLLSAGKEFGIAPIGLAARDTLRLEAAYCLYGNDIDESTSPIEAGLGWITKFTDEKNFIDKDFLYQQKVNGTTRRLVGFEMIDRGIPRQHYEIQNTKGEKIGEVTSGTMSPFTKKGIGMGYVETEYSNPGTDIIISIRNKPLLSRVVKTPFF
ncbi:MAG: glycine cleavage system aminomethyltransferase GcvT, partial [Bacteroidales bacterium]|nr:glycine cleavage system aminomethyltransferase GcvT [Bacteroidales bacterium]